MVNFEGVRKAILTMADGIEVTFGDSELVQLLEIIDDRGRLKGDLIVTDVKTKKTVHIFYKDHVTRIAFIYDSTIVGMVAK